MTSPRPVHHLDRAIPGPRPGTLLLVLFIATCGLCGHATHADTVAQPFPQATELRGSPDTRVQDFGIGWEGEAPAEPQSGDTDSNSPIGIAQIDPRRRPNSLNGGGIVTARRGRSLALPKDGPSVSEETLTLTSVNDRANIAKTPIDRGTATTPSRTAGETNRSSPLWTFGTLTALLAGVWFARTYFQRRQSSPRRRSRTSLIQVVESKPVDGQLMVHVLQVGRRVLIVGSSAAGLTTLSELTDPTEVADLLGSSPDPSQGSGRAKSEQTSLFGDAQPIRRSTDSRTDAAAVQLEQRFQRLASNELPAPHSVTGEPSHV